jgi:hypothetical protein
MSVIARKLCDRSKALMDDIGDVIHESRGDATEHIAAADEVIEELRRLLHNRVIKRDLEQVPDVIPGPRADLYWREDKWRKHALRAEVI